MFVHHLTIDQRFQRTETLMPALSIDPGKYINITLLGECRVRGRKQFIRPVPLGFFHVAAYLLLEGRHRTVERSELGRLIWSEIDGTKAGANLRQTIARIKRFQAEHDFQYIVVDPIHLSISQNQHVLCDLAVLLELLERPEPRDAVRLCELYGGGLLEVPGPHGIAFEEWISYQGERLRDKVITVVTNAISLDSPLDNDQREFCAHKLLAIDPYHEGAYRVLMTCAADRGETSVLRDLFDQCSRRLRGALGVAPEETTIQLYLRLTR
jgi:DNA-binding SARP family transcriptional activator